MAMMVFGGRIVHPCWVSRGRSMLYFSSFLVVASCWNVSLRYVNSKIRIFRLGYGENGGWAMCIVPCTHNMFGCSRVGHLHLGR